MSSTGRLGNISKQGNRSLGADGGMSVVTQRTVDSESRRNLLERTAEAKDFKKNKRRNYLVGVISFWKMTSQCFADRRAVQQNSKF